MEISADWIFRGVYSLVSLLLALALYSMRRTYVKHETLNQLEKRVQTVEQTYVEDKKLNELDKRVIKAEAAIKSLPKTVAELDKKVAELDMASKHLKETIDRVEHPLKLIIEASMKGDN